MLKRLLRFLWSLGRPYVWLFATVCLVAASWTTQTQVSQAQIVDDSVEDSSVELSTPANPDVRNSAPDMMQPGVQLDPLNSPFPIPWNWVMTTYTQISANGGSGVRYYRSPSLISPDGQYAAYSRIQVIARPELYESRVTSVMFVENLKTGDLRTITPSSPLADNPFNAEEAGDLPGVISIAIPVSWTEQGDQMLARQFEGLLSSSDASDFAVVWDRHNNSTKTLSPDPEQYAIAVLLGWSRNRPNHVLFKAGDLGEEHWPTWAVNFEGKTLAALEDQPIVFGETINHIWAGPQAAWR